jgi:glycine cleavage system H protein
MGAVESVKAASDIYAPVSGKIVEVNSELEADPSLANSDPYEKGWIAAIELTNGEVELKALMNEGAYTKMTEEE